MNILIVDDEFFIVQGIVNDLDWDKLGIDKICTAFSMSQAKDILNSTHIDILLVDIEMPKGNGLDLIIWANENGYHPISLILTGHQILDYALKAIKIHCFGYILKPASPSVLEAEIGSAVNAALLNIKEIEEPSSNFLISVKKCIAQNLNSTELNRTFIANKVHINPDYLSYLFHKQAGLSLTSYVLNERLGLAKKLLNTTNLSLQEISDQAGFSSSSYFHKQFKRALGITPQQYRSSHYIDE